MPSTHDEWKVSVRQHPGSSQEDIKNEPNWGSQKHEHYIGFKNAQRRKPGLTSEDENWNAKVEEAQEAQRKFNTAKKDQQEGRLINFQDALRSDKDLHLDHPEHRYLGWRFRLDFTESEIKSQNWPINIKKQQAEEKKKQEAKDSEDSPKDQSHDDEKSKSEDNKHGSKDQPQQQNGGTHDVENGDKQQTNDQNDSSKDDHKGDGDDEKQELSPQDAALLEAVKHEQEYMANLKVNDGTGHSNVQNRESITIDEADQFTPDNWIPRSTELIRLTGKHPVNAEAPLHRLFESGFITPNELHYVRSHGAVPKIIYELHRLKISCDGQSREFSMQELENNFPQLNLPILIACDNSRRKELNMIKRTTGFNWGPGGVGCAYWKGPMLRDVLLEAGVPEDLHHTQRYYIHFQGADNPNNVHYETSIPLEYVMDTTNDVLLAYEMNDTALPPDHGYPLRVVIPGYVGGRQVKWLQEIWINTKENDSYYHVHDNRILPSFVTESGSELADFFFHHPDTAAYEQALQSIIAVPAQGEKLDLKSLSDETYRVKGFAYNGRGDQVQRVELSLDNGRTWRYCIRSFPDSPIRHGRKFWTWCFWQIDVPVNDLIRAPAITVRALDVKKMTQPEKPVWNISGTLNNAQYVVKPELVTDEHGPQVLFRHPVEPGSGEGGWMKNSVENQLKDAERKTDAPKKQFTREEIEKHDTDKDCWLVIDNNVYDATSVLGWHPGGAAAIMAHAGAVHAETTSEFSSVHDEYAYEKLNECILGTVSDKAKKYIAKMAEEAKKESKAGVPDDQAMQQHRWTPVKMIERKEISEDSLIYRFQLPKGKKYLGVGTCQHVEVGFHMKDKMLIRPYTPIKPVLPRDAKVQAEDAELHDGTGFFDLIIKTYFPDEEQPGGALSNILYTIQIGEEIVIRGPTGDIVYKGYGKFMIYNEERTFKRVSLVLGGTGLTPGYSFLARSCLTADDPTEIRVIDANKAEEDILLRKELTEYEKMSKGRLKVTHVLSDAGDEWRGLKGHVDEKMIKEHLFEPDDESLVLLCGPPPMIQKAALPALQDWGYKHDENMFGF